MWYSRHGIIESNKRKVSRKRVQIRKQDLISHSCQPRQLGENGDKLKMIIKKGKRTMQECCFFVEIGIKKLGPCEDETIIDEIGEKVAEMFPKSSCTFCNAIFNSDYPGWTIGVADVWEPQVEALAAAFPKTRFVVKTVDNYGISLYEVKQKDGDFSCDCIY